MKTVLAPDGKTIWVFASPEEIRNLAQEAEQVISQAKLGDSLVVGEVPIEKTNFTLRLSADNTDALKHLSENAI